MNNISLNALFLNCYNFIRSKASVELSPLQKKVAWVALTYFSCATAGYFLFCCYRFHARQNHQAQDNKGMFHLRNNRENSPIISSPDHLEDDRIQDHDTPQDEEGKASTVQQPIYTKIEKNCRFAKEQQDKEASKGFALKQAAIPSFLSIKLKFSETMKSLRGESVLVGQNEVGIASCEGSRPSMEDADIATQFSFKINQKVYQANLFTVLDGHGGSGASAFVKEHLMNYLKEALEERKTTHLSDNDIGDALKNCCIKLDSDYPNDYYNDYVGTTATIAFVLGDKIWFANLGDSRAVLIKKDGTAVQATEDAKPNITRYQRRIEKRGGTVERGGNGIYRVNGNLAVATAIGDKGIKSSEGHRCILPNPKITCYPLADFKNGHLVVACDGLWDVVSSNEIGKAIKKMSDQKESVKQMAQRLVWSAIDGGSKDNVSTIVVKL